MRAPGSVAALAAAVVVTCAPGASVAQEPARRPEPTTHDVAACGDAQDRPVCLLRVIASGPSHFSYASRPEFAGRPELLALIEDPATTVEGQMKAGPKDAYDALSTIPMLQQREAIAAALAADKAGASPEEALRPIRELAPDLPAASMFLGQIITASGAELRSRAYESVWRAYEERSSQPDARPSLALARAALAKWDEHQGDQREEESILLPGLVEAYASLGDEAGARRAAARTGEPPAVANIRVLTALGRLDAAVTAAEALTPRDAPDEYGQDQVDSTRYRLLLSLLKTDRTDLARRISLARLEEALGTGRDVQNVYGDAERDSPLSILAREDGPQALEPWAERFEAIGRERPSARSLGAARWAVEAWVRAGRPERARAIVAIWTPRVERSLIDCNERPFCVSMGLRRMLLWTGDYAAAHALYPAGPDEIVEFDVVHGRGVGDIDAHVARVSDNPLQVEGSLAKCVELSAQRGRWDDVDACLDRLAARVDRPLDTRERDLIARNRASNMSSRYDLPHPRGTAFEAAWAAAQQATRQSDSAARERYVRRALQLGAGGPALALDIMTPGHVVEVATAELRAAGRL